MIQNPALRLTFSLVAGVLLFFVGLIAAFNMWENVNAHELLVVQSPASGELTCFTDPGIKWQGFGKTTFYPRRATYDFGMDGKTDNSKKLRFNDGGHANLYGSVSWEMPLDCPSIIEIHKTFGSARGVEDAAISKMIDSAVYLAGPLMSSTESSGERRAELVQYINDQAERGVYVTQTREKDVLDAASNAKKTVVVTEIVRDKDGNPKRQQKSILEEFRIKLLPMAINEIKYDSIVETQIAERQKATTQVQIAQANARRAEQEKLTTEAQGAANAAKAKWEQETKKAQAVTEAQQKFEVAQLAAKAAEQTKREQILLGEGEAERKRLVMNADGALDRKLEAFVEVNKAYAEAIQKYQGAWVPQTVMGGGNNQAGSGATAMVELLTAKTARDLSIDLGVAGKANTGKK